MEGVVAKKDGIIVGRDIGRGIGPALRLFRAGKFRGADVADKVVGKAAASLFLVGGAVRVEADLMCEGAAELLENYSIPHEATKLVPNIINRKKTGLCPMEKVVKDLDDPEAMVAAIERKYATMQKVEADANLSAFLSDIHVSGLHVKGQPTYQNPLFEKVVDQVLALRPRPARVVVFGDVALWTGRHEDYEASLPGFKRLTDAGIALFVTTGNHDHRQQLFAAHPKQKEITPVPGRVTSIVDLGLADLFLMDTLQENPKGEGFGNTVSGALDAAQADWLVKAAAAAQRPFFIGAHHPPSEIKIGGRDIRAAFEDNPLFAGYIHGHDHRWYKQWFHKGYSKAHVIRSACLPSTGWWGSIGFALMRTFPTRAELSFVQNDFFFPKPLAPHAKRPPEWDEIIRENKGSVCTFAWA